MITKRHVYHPPRGRLTGIFAFLGGVIATVAVFVAIPLSQQLSEQFSDPIEPPPEVTVAPPDDLALDLNVPPPEKDEPPPPPEPEPDATNLDMGLEIADLPLGTGGGFVMDIKNFAVKGGDEFSGGDLDSGPVPTSKFPPSYPNSLLSKGVGGKVLVSCEVDESGRIVSTKVRQSSGEPELDRAALAAVAKYKFKPAIKGGRKVRASCVVPFNFEVKRN